MEPSRVVHPSAELLRALAQGKLDDAIAGRVRSHLDDCPTCRAAAAAHDSYATQAPVQSFVETARPQQAPLGPTTLFNVPPELADNSEYEVLRELGRGGMGVVYQARHKLSGRLEALKVMSKALIGQSDSRERFLREIQAAARLDHKNVVKMYNALERGELMVLVMEYVEGEDLARTVKERGPLSVLMACYYVQQAAAGLQHAFEKGMVHRDIKPQNLMLMREGKRHTVKVLDLGLAKAARGQDRETGLTGTGAMMGTPGYVAPEQSLDAATADIRADVYSLGCTLYHLLAGAPPFTGKSLFEILQAHHSTEAKSLSQLRPEVSEELAAVVRKMMAKEPVARYQTPADVVRALDPFVKGGPKAPSTVAPAKGNRDLASPTVQALLHQATILPETQLAGPGSKTKSLPPQPGPPRQDRREAEEAERPNPWMAWLPVFTFGLIIMGILGLVLAIVMNKKEHDTGREVADRDTQAVSPITSRPIRKEDPNPPRPKPKEVSEKKTEQPPKPRPSPKAEVEKKAEDPPKPPPPPAPLPATITNSIGMKLVLIKPGVFLMGSHEDEAERYDDEFQHEVEITRPFYMGVYEVTQEQYERVMGENPSHFKNGADARQCPVERVSWEDADKFCRRLSELAGEKSNERLYHLPTEAEWEYVCRGGPFFKKPSPPFHFGNSLSSAQANFDGRFPYGGAKEGVYLGRTTKVGSYLANPLGIYDLHGNVREWCADWYDKDYYKSSPRRDPQGPDTGERRVLRGCSWCYGDGRSCRAACRVKDAPGGHDNRVGFRVVLVANPGRTLPRIPIPPPPLPGPLPPP